MKNENDAIRNRIPDYDKWWINFSTKNQLGMNNRRLPIAAEFHFILFYFIFLLTEIFITTTSLTTFSLQNLRLQKIAIKN